MKQKRNFVTLQPVSGSSGGKFYSKFTEQNRVFWDDRKAKRTRLASHKDPILYFIGKADIEPFGHTIETELYGDA
jgi:hypothetical protein